MATFKVSVIKKMGLLSMYIKPIFLGFMRNSHSLSWFIVFFSLINLSVCIYEDQIGKFDWRQSYVGRIKFAQFDTVSTAKKIIVATEENVLAALNLKTGQVVWRHVFESASRGNIQLLHVSDKVVSVSGSNPYLVRGWDSSTGVLLWEWSLTLQNDETADFSEWWVQQGMLVHMLPVFGSHLEVTMYNLVTGQNRGATSKLPALWSNDGCVVSPPYYTCISGNPGSQLLISLDVTSNAVKMISKPLSDYITANTEVNLRSLDGNNALPGFILDDKKIVLIRDEFEVLSVTVHDPAASVAITDSASGHVLLQTLNDNVRGFKLTAHSVTTGQELSDISASEKQLYIPDPEISAAICTKSREQHACRFLLTAADDASHLMQQGGRVLWTREEALANVVATEFVELPVSDLDAAIESEFDQKEGSIWGAFTRRLHTQYQQVLALIQSLQRGDVDDNEPTHLVRDYFNLHKIIVLVTDVGKVFGMDNLSGDILWRFYEPNLNTDNLHVFTRRTARHPPHDAYLSIVGKHEETGNAMIISINPITGASVGERTIHLNVKPLQCAMLHKSDQQKLHALIILDTKEKVHLFPETAAPLVENMYMYVVDKNTAVLQGYAIKYDGQSVVSVRTWRVLAGGAGGGRVHAVAARRAGERVHSAGTVLPDRSVLYKYNNRNLILVVVHVNDQIHKDTVIATCVDAVSGSVECSAVHRRARPTSVAINTDNMLAYVYYNDKHRRTEIASLELYEGGVRWVGAGEAARSLGAWRRPAVHRGAFVLPASAPPTAATPTLTHRAITDIHIIMASVGGWVSEVPWQWLEPTRGGAPEVSAPADATLNYNRTVARPRALHAAPAGLESTSLVLLTGLDLFYTRVAPSKTFDLLKEDFDYYLITLVLAALVVATYSTKYFASRKMLKMAWK